jgi:thioredoxin reductase (NADPH)
MGEKPVIVIVDDEPAELASLLEAVQRRFGADYRVAPFLTPANALQEIARVRSAGEDVALVVADQWMPERSGREVLELARALVPLAKRALLVPWGDRAAAPEILRGCAYGQLDYYLTKPWTPAEVHLYPPITEFLAEWTRANRPGLEVLKVIGDDDAPRSHLVCDLLARSGVPHGYYPASTAEGRRLLSERGLAGSALPVVLLRDGSTLVAPSNADLAEVLSDGGTSELDADLAVVGAGPAGLAAAVYGASEGLHTLVVERETVGGQAGTSSLIRNYLGFPRGISGAELAQRAYQQAWLFGAKYLLAHEVTRLRDDGERRVLTLSDGREASARAVIIATGARYRRLGIPRLEELVGVGVYYTPFDARFARDQDVYVAGGGNSAGQAAVHLATQARRVTLLVRGGSLEDGMSDYLVQHLRLSRNVEVRLGCEIVDGGGAHRLEWLTLRDRRTGAAETVSTPILFALIGALPHTDWLSGTVERDERGYLLTGRYLPEGAWPLRRRPMRYETSMPGVFAVGDVRHDSAKRVASAVGEGSVAVGFVHEFLADGGADRPTVRTGIAEATEPRQGGAAAAPPAGS